MIGLEMNKYIITRYIASGSFGDVFEAKNKKTGELVALKIPVNKENIHVESSLLQEINVYKKISNKDKGIANMKIIKHENRKILLMDLLGPSLDSLLNKYKKFSIKTVTLLAIQMIDIIKHVHTCGYIHRDIKPDNFVIGRLKEEQNKLYCIDFGLAKKYMKNDKHINFSNKKKFCGTARYASIAAHEQKEQSRKDDLESIGYILIYLYKGKLPWQGIKEKDKVKRYQLIGEKKKEITEEELCKHMPKEFTVFLKYVRTLDFDEKPHYSALKRMFENLYERRNYKNKDLEWNTVNINQFKKKVIT